MYSSKGLLNEKGLPRKLSHLCWSPMDQLASEESEVVQEVELPAPRDLGCCWAGHGGQREGNSWQLLQLSQAAAETSDCYPQLTPQTLPLVWKVTSQLSQMTEENSWPSR